MRLALPSPLRRLFDYLAPQGVPHAALQPGVRLRVPFGRREVPPSDRLGRRVALALVTLGLYIASSLLMQHGVGPRLGDMPVLALLGYALAIRFTFSIARSRG